MKKNTGRFQKGSTPWNKGLKNPYTLSEETRAKISRSVKEVLDKPEIHAKLGKHLIGKPKSDQTKARISKANKGRKPFSYGKHLTEEHKKNIQESNIKARERRKLENPLKEAEINARVSETLKKIWEETPEVFEKLKETWYRKGHKHGVHYENLPPPFLDTITEDKDESWW